MLVLDGRDGRKKITIKISDFQKQLETSIREVKTNLTNVQTHLTNVQTNLTNVERNLTNANQTTNALILTTAIKMIEGLDGNKQPLGNGSKWQVLCAMLNTVTVMIVTNLLLTDIGKSAADNWKPIGGVNK